MANHLLYTDTDTFSPNPNKETVERKVYTWDDKTDQVSCRITVTDRDIHKGSERERVFSDDIIPFSTCPQVVKTKVETLKAKLKAES
jgi:hypothetical protein